MDDINHQKYALSAEINFNFSACRIRKLELAGRGKGGGRCWLGLRVSPLSVAPEVGAFFWVGGGWGGLVGALQFARDRQLVPDSPPKKKRRGRREKNGWNSSRDEVFFLLIPEH